MMTETEETVAAVKSVAEEVSRSASSLLSKAGGDTANALHSAASVVRNAGNQSAAVIDGIAEDAAHGLASASVFVGSYDAGGMLHDIKRIVRRNPGPFVIIAATVAAAAGYLAGARVSGKRC